MLRYQPEIGAELETPLTRYLSLPVVPVQLGFDPRLQLLHADDATEALAAALRRPVRGAVNVGPPGSISLSRALRLCGRPALPIPQPLFEPMVQRLGRRLGAGSLLDDGIRMLRHGRGVDITRLVEEVGFEPRYDAVAAVRDLATKLGGRRIGPDLHPGALAGRLTGIGS
jgi:UDP-glucose 4-epimerase